jgi:uncharacterized protein YrzB (UPF0473 family)
MSDKDNIVVLRDETGKEMEFEVIDILAIDEEEYAILLPLEKENGNEEAVILKIGIDENGEDILFEIENDDEWEMVAKAWKDSIKENGDLQ